MSREIKFRVFFYDGKDKSTGEMITAEDALLENYIDFNNWWLKPTDKCSIIMQWTGLTDKNGKEIYEGDIVFSEIYGWSFYVFKGGSFGWDRGNHISVIDQKVMGNIHENPELLK